MKNYKINTIFDGFGAKRLSDVEINRKVSNQHEFNGVTQFKELFGEKRIDNIPAQFLYLTDEEDETVEDTGELTWYDSRENHPTRSEYRLYYSDNDAIKSASTGDLLIIARKSEILSAIVMIIKQGTTIENQMIWLFGFGNENLTEFYVKSFDPLRLENLDFASEMILEKIGIELPEKEDAFATALIEKYKNQFPKTRTFSEEIFNHLNKNKKIDLHDDPDAGISLLLQTEETYFKIIEKGHIQKKISEGFKEVDEFISYSLSVQNRRKSRAGYAFENHLETLFKFSGIKYDRGRETENNNKPDFIFPGIKEYKDTAFNSIYLSMLGVKTTCKDRWRQILPEADRIEKKHLATTEPSISQKQTDQMEDKKVTLVIPLSLHRTYNDRQKKIIITVKDFLHHVLKNQELSG
jgi:hypothetical protein